jgi:ABC-type uncharacterized transport system substrate-binding protein
MRLARLAAVAVLVLTFLTAPLGAEAQPAGKVYRIGFLHTGEPPSFGPPNPRTNFGAFRQALFELGYADERDLVIESRFAEGKVDRLPALAAELVALQVEVIVAANAASAKAAKAATTTIPIVFIGSTDPVGARGELRPAWRERDRGDLKSGARDRRQGARALQGGRAPDLADGGAVLERL